MNIGDIVEGIMGVNGGKVGVIKSIGSPFSSGTQSPTVHLLSLQGGEPWDTFAFNLKPLAHDLEEYQTRAKYIHNGCGLSVAIGRAGASIARCGAALRSAGGSVSIIRCKECGGDGSIWRL